MIKNISLILLMALIVVTGCRNENDDHGDSQTKYSKTTRDSLDKSANKTLVAKVNDVPIYREEMRGTNVEKAVETELLFQYGKNNGYLDERVKERVENFEKNLVTSKVKMDVIKDYMAKNPVTSEELNEEYEEVKAELIYLKLNEVRFSDKETANKFYEEIRSGKSLSEISSKYDQSKIKVREIDRATKRYNHLFSNLEVGNTSELLNNNGVYFFYIIAEKNQLPMDKVSRRLMIEKQAEHKRKAIDELVERLKQSGDYKVEIVN